MIDKAQAELEVKITSNLKEATDGLHEYESTFGRLPDAIKRAARDIEGALGGIGKASRDAGSAAGKGAAQGTQAWQDYADALRDANAAHKEFRQGQVTGEGGGTNIASLSDSTKASLLATHDAQQASGIGVLVKARSDAAKAEDDWAEASRRLEAIQKQRAQTDSGEANRQMEIRAAVEQRAQAERELAAALDRQNKIAADTAAIRASNSAFMGDTNGSSRNSVVGQGNRSDFGPAQSAAGTGLAAMLRGEEAKANEQAGRSYSNLSTEIDGAIAARQRQNASQQASIRAAFEEKAAHEQTTGSLISLRYALYDVSTTAAATGAALLAVPTLATGMAASFESSFTNVERTSDGSAASIENIRGQLVNLTTQIPLSFAEVSKIATLGNQLGVSAGDITGFTETVAKFSTVTGMSAESSAQAFGRISNILGIPISDAEKLGSAIALVGVRSAATEPEIISLVERLGATATRAGFTTDQVVGLSGALASLGVAPERAQGVFEKYFSTLNGAISEGGDALQNFATITGLTTDAVNDMVRSGKGFEVFEAFLHGMQGADTVELTGALNALGLEGLRSEEVIGRITDRLPLLKASFDTAAQGLSESGELSRQFGTKLDDLQTKIQFLQNALGALGAAGGEALLPLAKGALDAILPLIQGLTQMLSTPFGQWAAGLSIGLMAIVGTLTLVAGGAALGFASMAALKTAMDQLAASGIVAGVGVRSMAAALEQSAIAAGVSAGAINVFKVALISTGIGAAVVLLGTLAAAFVTAGQSASTAFSTYVGSTSGLADALAKDTAAYQGAVASGNTTLANSFVQVDLAADSNTSKMDDNAVAIRNTATVLGIVPVGFDSATDSITDNSAALGDNTIAWLKNQLMQSQAFQSLAGNAEFTDYWATIGANMDDVIRASAQGGQQAVSDYFFALEAQAVASGKKFQSAFDSYSMQPKGSKGPFAAGLFGGGTSNLFGTASGKGLNDITKALDGFNGQMLLAGQAGPSAASGVDEMTGSAAELADSLGGKDGAIEKVHTLVDYANDLSGVIERAFDIRFGGQDGLDAISSGWHKIEDGIAKTNDEIAKYKADIAELTADKKVKQYWLSVANNYGDTLRAGKLRGEIGDIDADLAKNSKGLTAAQAANSKSLTGNSEAAIANRAELSGMVGTYEDYIVKLASSGLSQDELKVKTEELKQKFIDQATQLGYSRDEVDKYATAFDDVKVAIGGIPREITVDANADPALQALNEFIAQAKTQIGPGLKVPLSTTYDGSGAAKAARAANLSAQIAFLQADIERAAGPNKMRIIDADKAQIGALSAQLNSGNYWTGGYVGDGGKYDPKGTVHGGEFVFSKEATRNIGVNNLAFQHNMAKKGKTQASSSSGAFGGGAGRGDVPQVVDFSAQAIQALTDALYVRLDLNGRVLAESNAAHNVNASKRRVS